MGNQLVSAQRLHTSHVVSELRNVVVKDNLAGGRFLKTALCVHDDGGLVIVKVYYKRGTCPELVEHEKLLFRLRKLLSSHTVPADSHLWPYQRFVETDRAAYIIRQYIFANLHDHLSTRPFLCYIEKCWIVFQMFLAVAHLQSAGFCHGDLKCENFLVTSWNWLFLTDFACYKPTYLPADNPAIFSFYFDTGGRRRCYLAPERFFVLGKDSAGSPDGHLRETMDIFSLGCCIAEVFLEGRALFDLSQLLSYRSGDYSPAVALEGLDHNVQTMILHMIQLDPGMRFPSAESYLSRWGSLVFPPYFGLHFHGLLHRMLPIDSDKRVQEIGKAFLSTCKYMLSSRRTPVPEATSDIVYPSHHAGLGDNIHSEFLEKPGMPGGSCKMCLSSKHGNWKDFIHNFIRETSVFRHTGSPLDTTARNRHVQKPNPLWVSRRIFTSCKRDGKRFSYELSTGRAIAATSQSSNPSIFTESFYSYATEIFLNQVQLPPPTWHLHAAIYGSASCTSSPEVMACSKGSLKGRFSRVASKTLHTSSLDIRFCYACQDKKCNCSSPSNLNFGLSWWKCAFKLLGNEASAPLHVLTLLSDLGSGSHCTGLVLLAALLCTLLRSSRLQNSKLQCLLLLRCTAVICDDEVRLQRIVPSLMAMLADPIAMVRAAAVDVISDVLAMLEDLPTSDTTFFQEYIFPGLSMLPGDMEEIVRMSYARNLFKLSSVAIALQMKYAVFRRDLSHRKSSNSGLHDTYSGDNLLGSCGGISCLLHCVERVIRELLASGKSTTATKQAIMPFAAGLARLIGRRRSTNFLLPLLISCLNTRSWQLTMVLFDNVTAIGPHTGLYSLDIFLMPCLEQALKSDDVSITWKVLNCLAKIVTRHQLNRRAVLKATFHAIPHLRSHYISSRSAAAMVVIASAELLPASDTHALLLPAAEDAAGVRLAQLSDVLSLVESLNKLLPKQNAFQSKNSGHASKNQTRVNKIPYDSLQLADVIPGKNADQSIEYLYTPTILSFGNSINAHVDTILAIENKVMWDINSLQACDLSATSSCSNMKMTIDACSSSRCAEDVSSVPPIKDVIAKSFRTYYHVTCREPLVARSAFVGHSADQNGSKIRVGDNCPVQSTGGTSTTNTICNENTLENQDTLEIQNSCHYLSCPRGLLIAHLSEHRRAVNHLSVSPTGLFFVSSSNDETVKVWDCCRLQRDVSFRSRLTYAIQGGKMLSTSFCESGESIASCSSAGSLHVWRVEYISRSHGVPDRYTGILARRQLGASEGAVLESMSTGQFSLIYSSQRGGISGLDLRCGHDVWNLSTCPRDGILERMVCDPRNQLWIMTGSSRGCLSVWDLRFNRQVSTWCISGNRSVQSMAFANVQGSADNPQVYIASGSNDVELWDVFSGCCRQVLRVSGESTMCYGADSLESQAALSCTPTNRQSYLPAVRSSGCKSVLCSGEEVVTAGSDKCIRCWNPSLSSCRVISGQPDATQCVSIITPLNRQTAAVGQQSVYDNYQHISGDEYTNSCKYTGHGKADRHVCHLDSILHMVSADINSERILITCGRDGIIKSWK